MSELSAINLKDAVSRLGRTDVEVVEVYTPSSQVGLLRVKSMPGYAFLMDVPAGSSGTGNSVIVFRYSDGKSEFLNAVCACCHTELQGIKIPYEIRDPRHPWYKAMAEIFRSAVAKACQENGIHTIFTRHGKKSWVGHYGQTAGLTVESKEAFVSIMSKDYPVDTIKANYAFLSVGTSIG